MTKSKTFAPLLILGLLAALFLGTQLVPPTDQATDRVRPASAARVPTPVLAIPPVPSPSAVPTPTPTATPTPTPLPTATRVANDRPDMQEFYEAWLMKDHLVVPSSFDNGLWVRMRLSDRWEFATNPYDTSWLGCRSELGGKAVFAVRSNDRTVEQLVIFDPIPAPGGDVWTTRQLPDIGIDLADRSATFCSGIEVGGTWVFAIATAEELLLATTRDEGRSFSLEQVHLQEDDRDWVQTYSVDLVGSTQGWVARVCFLVGSHLCGNAWMYVDTLADTVTPIKPSVGYRGEQFQTDPFPLLSHGFRVAVVGDELWQFELYDVVEVREAGDYEIEIGAWAVGPLGEPLVPLPGGFEPRLFPYGDAVVAELPRAPRWTLEGPSEAEVDWWTLAQGATEWTTVASPIVDWRDVAEGTEVTLFEADENRVLVIPVTPPADRSADPESGER